ncbi:MAG: family 20 glycosylhydrolase [Ferruginibacter sp.]|nr:family 20 glycosylhydrolase [Ferruginibacter sp.]
MKKLLLPVLFLLVSPAFAQVNISPMPVELKEGKGNFVLDKSTLIKLDSRDQQKTAELFNEYLQAVYGFRLKIFAGSDAVPTSANKIVFRYQRLAPQVDGIYAMDISARELLIKAPFNNGLFYGMQTLIQLLPLQKPATASLVIPQVQIKDYPRFAYRGMHLDVARHYFPMSFLKKYIDYLAYHKFNNFHWHLTDDQGWRIEIKKYPLLTSIGSCRAQTLAGRYGSDKYDGKKYCGFYTQEEVKQLVKYAADRYINVIPEIEMPGHGVAALSAYPYLGCTRGPYKVYETWGVTDDVFCAGNDSTFTFLQNVIDEVIALFPSKYIHIGGDECPKTKWKSCPLCQARIKAEHLKDEHELQSYFIQRMEKYINAKGRSIIGWDEILEGGLAPNATVMSWTGEHGGIAAAKQQHNAIMTPGAWCYFDHSQSRNEDSLTIGGYLPLEKVYGYEPVPKELNAEEAKYILGAQANLWTEYIDNPSKVQYMLFPRMTALSEVLWSPKEKRSWEGFEQRLPGIMDRYKLWNVRYSTAYYDLQPTVVPAEGNGISWKLDTKNTNGHIIYTKGETQNASFNYTGPLLISATGTYSAALEDGDHKVISNWVKQSFSLNKASGKKVTFKTEPNKSYSGSGGFSLVDGVQNKVGMPKSSEFLGWLGKDMEAVIDLEKETAISNIILHAFEQPGSWIYRPSEVTFYSGNNGADFTEIEKISTVTGSRNLIYRTDHAVKARYIKVMAKNYGVIPIGQAGAGTAAWMFADEIEVN